jgi:hypothetical protein
MTGKLPLEIIKDDYPPILPLHPDDVDAAMAGGEGVAPLRNEDKVDGADQ